MNRKHSVKGLVLLVSLVALLSFSPAWSQAKPGSSAPVITHSFAVDRGYYGSVWKIYIEAEDADGDMSRIAVAVGQVGQGHYPTHWIYLKPQNQSHLKGFLQWNTFSSKATYIPEWTRLNVRVSIFDKAGNESQEILLPFTFQSGANPSYELPPPFDRGVNPRLGYIQVDLETPYRGDEWIPEP